MVVIIESRSTMLFNHEGVVQLECDADACVTRARAASSPAMIHTCNYFEVLFFGVLW